LQDRSGAVYAKQAGFEMLGAVMEDVSSGPSGVRSRRYEVLDEEGRAFRRPVPAGGPCGRAARAPLSRSASRPPARSG